MREKIVKNKEVEIYTESFGDKQKPTILLMGGATVSMLFWDEEFCQKLAENGFFIIRYDNRDVGKSTCYPPGNTPYDLNDLVDDAILIMEEYNIQNAHFVGMSLGGLLAQIAGIKYPTRVKSISLIGSGPFGPSEPGIPEMDKRILDFHSKKVDVEWTDENSVVTYMLEGVKLLSGSKGFKKKRCEKLIREEFRRANNYVSMFNHAALQGGEKFYGRLSEIKQAVLIIHGTDDQIWHFRHTVVLQRELANSKLVALKGSGHEIRHDDWDRIINEISLHVDANIIR